VKGGIIDAPIAFGIVKTRTEASRWLADRGLIAATDASKANGPREPRTPPRLYTNRDRLPPDVAGLRTLSLLTLLDEIGALRLRVARDAIAEMRYQRAAERGCGCSLRMFQAIAFAREELPDADAHAIVARARDIERHAFDCVDAWFAGRRPRVLDECVA